MANNPFPPVGNVGDDGWEVLRRDAVPSVECRYELDEDEEDREAALQQCATDARAWLNALPHGEYRVQFGVSYELPDVQFVGGDPAPALRRQRNFQWNAATNRHVPLPAAAVASIRDELLSELENDYGTDEWRPKIVYMHVQRGTGDVVALDELTASERRRQKEKQARDNAKRAAKDAAKRRKLAGQRADGSTAQRSGAVRHVHKSGRPQQQQRDPTALVRAVALALREGGCGVTGGCGVA
jgi:hypothetical protein